MDFSQDGLIRTIIWVLSALLAGSLARIVTRSRSRGFVVDTALGTFGSVAGAWLLRFAYGDVPAGNVAHIATSLTGAIALIFAGRLVRPLAERASAEAAKIPVVGPLEERLRRLSGTERVALESLLMPRLLQDPNAAFRTELTLGQRVADRVATFGGSWSFLGFFAAFMLGWMFVNTQSKTPADPYPFILLNLVLSCLAAIQAPVIMMSQNRQSARDRFDAKQDYEVNLRAELQIAALHQKIDDARASEWRRLVELLEAQDARLIEIERRISR
jgi:uncharacterized membrane protein/uncharacterized membrane protein YeaQ/YmgE (transglycosylase-associated protein family)